jgi:archaellum biogenesis ATPase FlaH
MDEMAKVARLQARHDAAHTAPEAIVTTASQITPRPLDPVWDGVLWAGKPTLIAGDPGLGKSMLTADVAARVTTGAPWPCSEMEREPANVVMLSAEDDAADTIVPRLMAAGADLKRIAFVDGIREMTVDGIRNGWLSLDRHLEQLGDVLAARRPRLVIVDPLSAYLGRDTDSHNEGDVRTVLAGMADLAVKYQCAVLCVRHLRKSESSSAQHKIIGSIAFTAAARAVYVVVRDPDDEDHRLFLCAKNNLAPDTSGYGYVIKVNDDGTPYVGWGDERETRTADEVMGAATDKSHAVDGAEDWLRAMLTEGPVYSRDMRQRAEEAGHSWRTVERARQKMGGIKIERDVVAGGGARGPWQWRLTTPPGSTPPPPHLNSGGLGGDGTGSTFPGIQNAHTATTPSIGNGGGVAHGDDL